MCEIQWRTESVRRARTVRERRASLAGRQLEREGLPNGVHRGSLSHYGALAERKARYRLPVPHLRAIRFYIPRAPPVIARQRSSVSAATSISLTNSSRVCTRAPQGVQPHRLFFKSSSGKCWLGIFFIIFFFYGTDVKLWMMIGITINTS